MATESSHSWMLSYKGMSSDNIKGLVLALSSSLFIGASFIVKKKGLKKAGASGVRAVHFTGVGGYSYLYEPLWWAGMTTMIVGEIANFAAYAFAPAILVTPLGALSIIISAVLAHIILREKLHIFGILGCVLCVVGSTTIVLHAPQEREIESVKEVWDLATEPAFVLYAALVIAGVFVLIYHFIPHYGQTHIMVYIGVCSLMGSLSVMSVKALGIALKLTFSGTNQLIYPQTWVFVFVVLTCVITQMNYLNKALDTFNTAVVSPIYYVMFTSLTILASVIMFKDWDRQNPTQIVTEMCGFVTILSGTFLLHKTKDMTDAHTGMSTRISKQTDEEDGYALEAIPLRHSFSSLETASRINTFRSDYEEEDTMDMLWEDFNEEIHWISSLYKKNETGSELHEEMIQRCFMPQALKTSKGTMVSSRKTSVYVMVKLSMLMKGVMKFIEKRIQEFEDLTRRLDAQTARIKELKDEFEIEKKSMIENIKAVDERYVELSEREETISQACTVLRVESDYFVQSYRFFWLTVADIELGQTGKYKEIVFALEAEDEVVGDVVTSATVPVSLSE
ncbi:hypothetical protein GIB67_026292 [Kingdonia uniflora]|uniref:Probable magnesium transporter n=1 Tax=Kingdonia uniflora TaxID=39325 RepID=A0A7J7LAA0_9MAGN|nr:hypothetical protein GIB67_026292 [Kingdonia uniflora]